jgi:hypothetical protein
MITSTIFESTGAGDVSTISVLTLQDVVDFGDVGLSSSRVPLVPAPDLLAEPPTEKLASGIAVVKLTV